MILKSKQEKITFLNNCQEHINRILKDSLDKIAQEKVKVLSAIFEKTSQENLKGKDIDLERIYQETKKDINPKLSNQMTVDILMNRHRGWIFNTFIGYILSWIYPAPKSATFLRDTGFFNVNESGELSSDQLLQSGESTNINPSDSQQELPLFSGGLKLNLSSIFKQVNNDLTEHEKEEKSPATDKINFATRLGNGELVVEQITPEKLPEKTGQLFQWADIPLEIITTKSTEIKTNGKDNKHELKLIYDSLKTQKKMAIIKINDTVGYGVVALEKIDKNETVGIYSGLYTNNDFSVDLISLNEDSTLKHLQQYEFYSPNVLAKIGSQFFILNRIRETVREINGEDLKVLTELFANRNVSEKVQSITSNEAKTLPSNLLENDDYALTLTEKITASGLEYRNFLPFISHALHQYKPYSWPPYEPSLQDFQPANNYNNKNDWHNELLSVNVDYRHVVYSSKGHPFITFSAAKPIEKGELLSWNYGIKYWKGRQIAPSFLTKDGKIIDSSSYIYNPHYTTLFYVNSMEQMKWNCAGCSNSRANLLTPSII